MGRVKNGKNPDRYITERDGIYQYKRRVPTQLIEVDPRGAHVRLSLKTDDLAQARAMRDVYEAADDEYWSSLLLGRDGDDSLARYQLAVKRAQSLGFVYRPATEIAKESVDTILQRVEAIISPQTVKPLVQSIVGVVDVPTTTVTQAFKTYVDEIVAADIRGKSKAQRKRWEANKQLAIDGFVEVVGNLAMDKITRDDALKYYRHWNDRIAPKIGKASHSASHGNRMIGTLRVLHASYFSHIGDRDRQNPFDRLGFSERKKRKRPPFPVDWITGKIMAPGALAGLNEDARHILFAIIESGARLSEICNLRPEYIFLDHAIPHVKIEPHDDPDDPREIKTESSIRIVPLVGVALAAMKLHPQGFARYKDKGDSLSATLNKFFRENDLFPSEKHTIYSLRHSMEDRMKDGNLDAEFRRIMMGHALDRPEYGEGGSLAWRQEQLNRIVLTYDPSIV